MMNPVGTSSIVFVSLSGLFWGGWLVGSQTEQGQEALARAYTAFAAAPPESETLNLFDTTALRALVCGSGADAMGGSGEKPCLAVAAAGKLFIIDAGYGAASALQSRHVPLGRLEAVLLTGADPVRAADLDQLWVRASGDRGERPLPVYGPVDSHQMVAGLNMALAAQGVPGKLEPWAPAPEPDAPVIVYEGDGLKVSAFTTLDDAQTGRVGYRFDYRGRSLVVAGDGRAQWAEASPNVDVVLNSAQTQQFAHLHDGLSDSPFAYAANTWNENARMVVLTGVDPNPMIADLQVRKAREAGLREVLAGRTGLLLELPLTSREVNVRAL